MTLIHGKSHRYTTCMGFLKNKTALSKIYINGIAEVILGLSLNNVFTSWMRVNAWLIGKINNIPRGLPTDNSQKINILYFLDLFLDCSIYRLSLKYFWWSLSAKFKRLFRLLRSQHPASGVWKERIGNSRARLMCLFLFLKCILLGRITMQSMRCGLLLSM